MTRPTLLESEGWRPISRKPLRCACPACGVELSSNAFSRFKHREKCPSWGKASSNAPTVVGQSGPSATRGEQSPVVRPDRVAAVTATNDLARNPAAPPPPPRLRWTACRVAGVEEWSTWVEGSPLVSLRVRRVGMRAEQRFEAYAGKKYAGSQATAEAAMGAAERFHDEGEV